VGVWDDAEVISTYTREQAIEDGVLVDVSEMACEASFKVPVAITRAVWEDINDIPPSRKGVEDWRGRLWDLLWLGAAAAKGSRAGQPEMLYRLVMSVGRKKLYTAKLHIGPGDEGEPVITLMRPEED
jgi:hypothetical protein